MNVTTQMFRPRLGVQAEGIQAEGLRLVYLVCLVDLVHLVSFAQADRQDRPNRPNGQGQLAGLLSIHLTASAYLPG